MYIQNSIEQEQGNTFLQEKVVPPLCLPVFRRGGRQWLQAIFKAATPAVLER